MKTYQKKPTIVQAIQYTGENLEEIKDFSKGAVVTIPPKGDKPGGLAISSFGEKMTFSAGDYIIKGNEEGDFYPCKPDVFEKNFVDSDSDSDSDSELPQGDSPFLSTVPEELSVERHVRLAIQKMKDENPADWNRHKEIVLTQLQTAALWITTIDA